MWAFLGESRVLWCSVLDLTSSYYAVCVLPIFLIMKTCWCIDINLACIGYDSRTSVFFQKNMQLYIYTYWGIYTFSYAYIHFHGGLGNFKKYSKYLFTIFTFLFTVKNSTWNKMVGYNLKYILFKNDSNDGFSYSEYVSQGHELHSFQINMFMIFRMELNTILTIYCFHFWWSDRLL